MTLLNTEEKPVHENKTSLLIDKYKIPLTHFEYDYIEKCTNAKELEKIILVLRSGEEGFFPDLEKFAEKRLGELKPKSKLLYTSSRVINKRFLSSKEQEDINTELGTWLDCVSKKDEELATYKTVKTGLTLPEIRRTGQFTEEIKDTARRISSTDYPAWDKYDPDTEILKMELEEQRIKTDAKPEPTKKVVKFREFTSDVEALDNADHEREIGNEYYKSHDYNEALNHYTTSISCKPTIASFTNRALIYLKLKKFTKAIDDCNSALRLDDSNIKALSRKAQALLALKHYEEALNVAEGVIKLEPNNSTAQSIAEKARGQCGVNLSTTRLKIQEVDSEVLVPIPGTSRMQPPFYVKCTQENHDEIEKAIIKRKASQEIIHLVPADNSDVEDDSTKLDQNAGGEPFLQDRLIPESIVSPYNFLKSWNSAQNDPSLEHHASIIRAIELDRIVEVTGGELDSSVFSKLIKCLAIHFAVPGEIERLHKTLENLINLPRFDIIGLLMSPEDRNYVNMLINFLKQHGKPLSDHICKKLLN